MSGDLEPSLAAACAVIRGGEALVPILARVGLKSCKDVVARLDPPGGDERAVREAHEALEACGRVGNVEWRPPGVKDAASGMQMLRRICMQAKTLLMKAAPRQEAAGGFKPLASAADVASDATGAKADDAAKQRRVAGKLYDRAEEVYATSYDAEKRVKYDQVSKLHTAFTERQPIAMGLGELTRQLAFTSAKKAEYSAFGQTWTSVDATATPKEVTTETGLYRQLELLAEARAIAGCYDAAAAATEYGFAVPSGEKVLAESTKVFVRVVGGEQKVVTLDCFATPAVQQRLVTKVRGFRELHPHVSVESCVSGLSVPVERKIANLLMRGFTADAAVHYACEKCPELWLASAVEAASKHAAEVAQPATGGGGGGGGGAAKNKRASDRSAEEQLAAKERRIEQQEKQIANLKNGRGGGGGGRFGGRVGGQWAPQGPPQYQPQAPPQQQPYQQRPPPTGPPCPPDVCKDFNFKAAGCTRTQCRLKHTCAVCGQNHPWRGNH